MFLIDTVTLSELRRRERDPMVVAWFERQRTTDLFLSVISIGEIERGIARQTRILRARLRPGWIGC
jgi:predicted nucleic acid-binding protein